MQTITMYTASGEAHGLVNTLTNSCENNDFKHMTPANKAKLEADKKEDSKLVKYEYINRKGTHERLVKPYCRYAGDPIFMYNLIPGKIYELPKGFAKEVNEMKKIKRSGLMEVNGERVTQDGSPLDKDMDGEWEHRLVRSE